MNNQLFVGLTLMIIGTYCHRLEEDSSLINRLSQNWQSDDLEEVRDPPITRRRLAKYGEICYLDTDCEGWGWGMTDMACCYDQSCGGDNPNIEGISNCEGYGRCDRKVVDWAGFGYCETECAGNRDIGQCSNGGWQSIKSLGGKCIDVSGHDQLHNNGARPIIFDCNAGLTQSFMLSSSKHIMNEVGGCLGAYNGDLTYASPDYCQDFITAATLRFKWYYESSTREIRNAETGQCLQIEPSEFSQNYGDLQMEDCNKRAEQMWYFVDNYDDEIPGISVNAIYYDYDNQNLLELAPVGFQTATCDGTNGVGASATLSYSKSSTESSTFTNSVENSIAAGTSVSVGIEGFFNIEASLQYTFSYAHTWGETYTDTIDHTKSYTINCPAGRKAVGECFLWEGAVDIPYSLEYKLDETGYIFPGPSGVWTGVQSGNIHCSSNLCNEPDQVYSSPDLQEFYPQQGGSYLAAIDIVDQMEFAINVEIHSYPSGVGLIFICSPNSAVSSRMPVIYLYPYGGKAEFKVGFTSSTDPYSTVSTLTALELDQVYSLKIIKTQRRIEIYIDDEEVINEDAEEHETKDMVSCYIGSPYHTSHGDPADVTITNIYIEDQVGEDCV